MIQKNANRTKSQTGIVLTTLSFVCKKSNGKNVFSTSLSYKHTLRIAGMFDFHSIKHALRVNHIVRISS